MTALEINFLYSMSTSATREVIASGALLSVMKAMHTGVRLGVGVKAENTTQDELVCKTTLNSTVTK